MPSSPLVCDCMMALYCVLPLSLAYDLLSKFLRLTSNDSTFDISRGPSSVTSSDPHWQVFVQLISSLLNGSGDKEKQPREAEAEHASKATAHEPKIKLSSKLSSGVTPLKNKASLDLRKRDSYKERPNKMDEEGTDDDWQFLMETEYHRSQVDNHVFRKLDSSLAVSSPKASCIAFLGGSDTWTDKVIIRKAIQALHLVYEDYKLNLLNYPHLLPLACLLLTICKMQSWNMHADHYYRDFPILYEPQSKPDEAQQTKPPSASPNVEETTNNVPSIYGYLYKRLIRSNKRNNIFSPFPVLRRSQHFLACRRTRQVCLYYDILMGGDGKAFATACARVSRTTETPEQAMVIAMVNEGSQIHHAHVHELRADRVNS